MARPCIFIASPVEPALNLFQGRTLIHQGSKAAFTEAKMEAQSIGIEVSRGSFFATMKESIIEIKPINF